MKKDKEKKYESVFNKDLTLVLSLNVKELVNYYKKHLCKESKEC